MSETWEYNMQKSKCAVENCCNVVLLMCPLIQVILIRKRGNANGVARHSCHTCVAMAKAKFITQLQKIEWKGTIIIINILYSIKEAEKLLLWYFYIHSMHIIKMC